MYEYLWKGGRRGERVSAREGGAEGSIGVGLAPGLWVDDDTLTLLPSRCPKVKCKERFTAPKTLKPVCDKPSV